MQSVAVGEASKLAVFGCQDPEAENVIQGIYVDQGPTSSNHGKPVFKKEATPSSANALIYFWDERDGPSSNGWWIGPSVGGDQVWAYNCNPSPLPPIDGWRVVGHGQVNTALKVMMTETLLEHIGSALESTRKSCGPEEASQLAQKIVEMVKPYA